MTAALVLVGALWGLCLGMALAVVRAGRRGNGRQPVFDLVREYPS